MPYNIFTYLWFYYLQMPEISASHKSLGQFLLQILGMLSGVGIMLVIALYEGDLMSVFGTAGATSHKRVH